MGLLCSGMLERFRGEFVFERAVRGRSGIQVWDDGVVEDGISVTSFFFACTAGSMTTLVGASRSSAVSRTKAPARPVCSPTWAPM